jgi:hypothetical protein
MAALVSFQSAYNTLDDTVKAGESQAAALPAAREALKMATATLLLEVSSGDAAAAAAVDAVLVTYRPPKGKFDKPTGPLPPLLDASLLKGSLLAALKTCAHYPAILAMPELMETTRKLLCGAPAKGVATFLIDELGTDIDRCTDGNALAAVQEVLRIHMQAEGRLKKDLLGFVLSADNTKSVRTAANKAAKALAVVEVAQAEVASVEAAKEKAAVAKQKREDFAALNAGAAAIKIDS